MKKKILIIDDNPEDNSFFISVLEKNHEVDVTAYISSARIKLEQSNKYDLIVLDIMMPTLGEVFNGIDTADGLKTGLAYYEAELIKKEIPVLFWSWNEAFVKETKEKGWDKVGFLLKETDVNHLLKGVERFCEGFNI